MNVPRASLCIADAAIARMALADFVEMLDRRKASGEPQPEGMAVLHADAVALRDRLAHRVDTFLDRQRRKTEKAKGE